MILSVHIIIGATVAAKTGGLGWGLLLAFLSHYLFDTLPHAGYSVKNLQQRKWGQTAPELFKIFLDIFVGFFLVLWLSKNTTFVLLGGLVAILPDGLNFLAMCFPSRFFDFFNKFHLKINDFSENINSPFLRVIGQIVVAIIALAVLYN